MSVGTSDRESSGAGERAAWTLAGLPWATRVALGLALIVFIGASYSAYVQAPGEDVDRTPTGPAWWLYPRETHPEQRLPAVSGVLTSVWPVRNSQHVWAVGTGGLILHSPDDGRSWERIEFPLAEYQKLWIGRNWPAPPQPPPMYEKAAPQGTLEIPLPPAAPPAKPEASEERKGEAPVAPTPRAATEGESPFKFAALPQDQNPLRNAADAIIDPTQQAPLEPAKSAAVENETTPAPAGLPELSLPPGIVPGLNSLPLLLDVRFLDEGEGWILGEDVALHTTDAGKTWTLRGLIESVERDNPELVDVVGRRLGLAADAAGGQGDKPAVYAIAEVYKIPIAAAASFPRPHLTEGEGALLCLSDAGVQLVESPVGAGDFTGLQYHAIDFLDSHRGWIAATGVYQFPDRDENPKAVLEPLAALPPGPEPVLVETTDGGAHWAALLMLRPPPTTGAGGGDILGYDDIRAVDAETLWGIARVQAEARTGATVTTKLVRISKETPELQDAAPEVATGLLGLAVPAGNTVVAVGEQATIVRGTKTADGVWTWETLAGPTPPVKVTGGTRSAEPLYDLLSVAFRGPQQGWAVGSNGTVLATRDGGATWRRQTRNAATVGPSEEPNVRRVAPWYYVSLLLVVGLMYAGVRLARFQPVVTRRQTRQQVAELLVSDRPLRPGDLDPLNFARLAHSVSGFLQNKNTQPPLTVAVKGDWGSGKSSLMNLIAADLEKYGHRCVWFNAWHHQSGDYLLAALLQAIRQRAVLPWRHPHLMKFWFRLFKQRLLSRPSVWVSLLVFVVGFSYLWTMLHESHEGESLLVRLMLLFSSQSNEAAPGKLDSLFSLLKAIGIGGGTLGSLFVFLFKSLKTFIVNPAALSAGAGSSAQERLHQANFRHQFAREFNEFAGALRPYRLAIFIDDLDRCQADHVFEVLEAVNFLVSSGECLVVLGLDERRIRQCIGRRFQDMAEAEPERLPVGEGAPDVTEAVAADPATQAAEAQKRLDKYARNYLEKLINISVQVPRPSRDQWQHLLLTTAARRESLAATPQPSANQRPSCRDRVKGLTLRAATPLLAMLTVVVFWKSGAAMREYVADAGLRVQEIKSVRKATPRAEDPVSVAPVREAAPPSDTGPDLEFAPNAVPHVLGDGTAANAVPDPRADLAAQHLAESEFKPAITGGDFYLGVFLGFSLSWLVLAALVGYLFWQLATPADALTEDTPKFQETLSKHLDFITWVARTPRALKRFLNRVRYLAALQQEPPRVASSRWSWFGRKTPEPVAEPAAAAESPPPGTLPLEQLIEFCVVELYDDRWINEDNAQSRLLQFLADSQTIQQVAEEIPQIADPKFREDVERRLAALKPLRPQFRELAGGVRMSGTLDS